uniref:Uncharacterized protein n=1 Tax=Gossypium raimondii TaxID=29730 RepID=A0A0D2VJZ2_GOSRA|nr:hypothetical protein B456_013G249900 [Gossypium raimondii]
MSTLVNVNQFTMVFNHSIYRCTDFTFSVSFLHVPFSRDSQHLDNSSPFQYFCFSDYSTLYLHQLVILFFFHQFTKLVYPLGRNDICTQVKKIGFLKMEFYSSSYSLKPSNCKLVSEIKSC